MPDTRKYPLEHLLTRFAYDPETGAVTWKSHKLKRKVGTRADRPNGNGYLNIKLGKTTVLAHRFAWFAMMGAMPEWNIDHINGDRSDNRWTNLREASIAQNHINGIVRCDNESGFRGVSQKRDKWHARIKYKGYIINLGNYPSKELAFSAYRKAAQDLYGEFADYADKWIKDQSQSGSNHPLLGSAHP